MPEKEYLTQLVFAIMKCSAIANSCKEALDISTELYKDCYDFAEKTKQVSVLIHISQAQHSYHLLASHQVSRVNNFFLAQLGFLRLEDKAFKPAYDVYSCRAALNRAIEKNSFSDETAGMFKLFLDTSKNM